MATQLFGVPLKYISLSALTLQNSALAILLHHSRTAPNAKFYSASAAVLLNEVLKCFISFIVALYNARIDNSPIGGSRRAVEDHAEHKASGTMEDRSRQVDELEWIEAESSPFLAKPGSIFDQDAEDWTRSSHRGPPSILRLSRHILSEILSTDCWKLSIPAILYVIQNNLQFVAASNLDVATFSVTYQLKILTTALCSVVMLRRRLSVSKWFSLLFLAAGVALVQVQNVTGQIPSSRALSRQGDRFIGFVAVTCACFTSGLAGVYFELVLKSSNKVDLWIRNIQLSLFSLLPALLTAFLTTWTSDEWLFANFGFWAWATVLTQVIGGLVTALVIKFADNILKGFATSLSIILSTLAGVYLFGSPLPLGSALGSLVVLLATYAYNSTPENPPALLPRSG